MDSRIAVAIEQAHERGELGIQVAAYLDGELILDLVSGDADPDNGRPVEGSTLFPAFSVNKAVVATALHLQVERGLVDYDRPIAEYWPEYGVAGKERTTVAELLCHRSGAPQMPAGVTTEKVCDWETMTRRLAAEEPIFKPGTVNSYHSISWGWLVGEIVRRSDPERRSFDAFVREEICKPLGIRDLYVALPPSEDGRVATLVNGLVVPSGAAPGEAGRESEELRARTMPPGAAPIPEVFGQPAVWHAEIPGAGGIMTARDGARVFAMLACGGELDGVRLLSEDRLRSLLEPRPEIDAPDRVSGIVRRVGVGGYWIGGEVPPGNPLYGGSDAVLGHAGAGGSDAWADLDSRLAVVVCHNRMYNSDIVVPDEHPFLPVADAIRAVAAEHPKSAT
jgi:CubicO group peptidase (beta-lactamase class C family)